MDLDLDRFSPVSPDAEPGMNLISADFDLIMVNRVNERLYGKPMVEMLGKKCYREFEKREAPCPHCPGRLSLISGESHEAETEGIRDDGTWFSARVHTHPVQGPGNQPTGFIEVVEDTTEEKRAEKIARIDSDLQTALAAADTVQKALLDCLEAALCVEGINAGCIFAVDWTKRETKLVLQRNFSPDYVGALAESSLESAMSGELPAPLARVPGAPRTSELIPIIHRSQRVAVMVVGAYVYSAIPPSLRAGLHNLGATAGNAISRIIAERSRGDAVADLEAFITIAPVAAWLLDHEDRVTMWNRAAERLLLWGASEVVGRRLPFASPGHAELFSRATPTMTVETSIARKDGALIDVRLVAAPFRDVVGNGSTTVVTAEDVSFEKRLAALEKGLAMAEEDQRVTKRVGAAAADDHARRVLVIDALRSRRLTLVDILESLGYIAMAYKSVAEAAPEIAAGETLGAPFALAIVDLVASSGPSALDQRAALRCLGLQAPVIVCSDSEVLGHEQHGFAGAIRRPYEIGSIDRALRQALGAAG